MKILNWFISITILLLVFSTFISASPQRIVSDDLFEKLKENKIEKQGNNSEVTKKIVDLDTLFNNFKESVISQLTLLLDMLTQNTSRIIALENENESIKKELCKYKNYSWCEK